MEVIHQDKLFSETGKYPSPSAKYPNNLTIYFVAIQGNNIMIHKIRKFNPEVK